MSGVDPVAEANRREEFWREADQWLEKNAAVYVQQHHEDWATICAEFREAFDCELSDTYSFWDIIDMVDRGKPRKKP